MKSARAAAAAAAADVEVERGKHGLGGGRVLPLLQRVLGGEGPAVVRFALAADRLDQPATSSPSAYWRRSASAA